MGTLTSVCSQDPDPNISILDFITKERVLSIHRFNNLFSLFT